MPQHQVPRQQSAAHIERSSELEPGLLLKEFSGLLASYLADDSRIVTRFEDTRIEILRIALDCGVDDIEHASSHGISIPVAQCFCLFAIGCGQALRHRSHPRSGVVGAGRSMKTGFHHGSLSNCVSVSLLYHQVQDCTGSEITPPPSTSSPL